MQITVTYISLNFFSLFAIRAKEKPNPREKGGRHLHRVTEYKEIMSFRVDYIDRLWFRMSKAKQG